MANVGSYGLSKSQEDISRVFGIDFEAANGVSEAKFGYGNHLTRGIMILHRWWFQRFFIFIPGEMIQFDSYFSDGLKPPTS